MTRAVFSCPRTRGGPVGYRRGEVVRGLAALVEAHLAQCPACRVLRERDEALVTMIHSLPVTPAPATLRRRIQETDRPARLGGWLGRPWAAASVGAVVVALALAPWLQFRRERAPDPVDTLVAAGVSEYERILLELRTGSGGVTDPAAAFATVRAVTDVELPHAFAGDEHLQLVVARPTLIADRKAAAAALRYQSGSVTTYFALPGKDLPMPGERRVQIEQYRPYVREVHGFQAIYWKQGDLAYLMVTDLDEQRSRQLFLKMRKAL